MASPDPKRHLAELEVIQVKVISMSLSFVSFELPMKTQVSRTS